MNASFAPLWLSKLLPNTAQRQQQRTIALQQLCLAPQALNATQLRDALQQIQQANNCSDLLPLCAHRNGHLRAAVLARMAEQPAASQINAIVARLNDWVPEVRLAARAALRSHLQEQYFALWLQAWPQVRRLYHCQRAVHRHVVMEVEAFLLHSKHKHAICKMLYAENRELAREACRLVAHAELIPKTELIAYALASRDRQIAGCAPAWICELPPSARSASLRLGLHAPLTQVRKQCQKMLEVVIAMDSR